MTIVSLLFIALLFITIYVASHRLSGFQTAIVVLAFFIGIAMVAFPSLAERAARAVGVGRGTDLLVYFSIVGGLFVTANFYFRLKRQEAMIIQIARKVAILDPRDME